jgi:hypothetical protein
MGSASRNLCIRIIEHCIVDASQFLYEYFKKLSDHIFIGNQLKGIILSIVQIAHEYLVIKRYVHDD